MAAFRFLNLPYQNPRVMISNDHYSVTRLKYENKKSGPRGLWIAYTNQPLAPGSKLILQTVSSTEAKQPPVFSFEIGFTTCDQASILKFKNHRTSVCHADGRKCGGESFAQQVRLASSRQSFICVQREEDGKFRITQAKESFVIDCKNKVFDGPLTTFIFLTGEVDAVRIIRESDLTFLQTPSGFAFQFRVPEADSSKFQERSSISKSDDIGSRMVFFNGQLGFGAKIYLSTETSDSFNPVAFAIGFTSCDKSNNAATDAHLFNFHDPDTCTGHYVLSHITSDQAEGVICIERTDGDAIKVTTGGESRVIKDADSVFTCRKIFPFIVPNGSADSLTIYTNEEADRVQKALKDLCDRSSAMKVRQEVRKQPMPVPAVIKAPFKLPQRRPQDEDDRNKPNQLPAVRKKRSARPVTTLSSAVPKASVNNSASHAFVTRAASPTWPRLPATVPWWQYWASHF